MSHSTHKTGPGRGEKLILTCLCEWHVMWWLFSWLLAVLTTTSCGWCQCLHHSLKKLNLRGEIPCQTYHDYRSRAGIVTKAHVPSKIFLHLSHLPGQWKCSHIMPCGPPPCLALPCPRVKQSDPLVPQREPMSAALLNWSVGLTCSFEWVHNSAVSGRK